MAHGGARPGSGPTKGVKYGKRGAAAVPSKSVLRKTLGMTPLEYMLSVMNDGEADESRRDRMAQAAAPYVHAKVEAAQKGKKEERQDAAEKAASKFAPPSPPKLVVNNGR